MELIGIGSGMSEDGKEEEEGEEKEREKRRISQLRDKGRTSSTRRR
jgi:hypothetical protein